MVFIQYTLSHTVFFAAAGLLILPACQAACFADCSERGWNGSPCPAGLCHAHAHQAALAAGKAQQEGGWQLQSAAQGVQ